MATRLTMHRSERARAKPPLTLPDFERVFRTIHGVLLNEKGNPARACLYFGVIGAAILQKHHRLSASAVVGAAGYNIGTSRHDVLAFVKPLSNAIRSSEDGFHCWVKSKDWAIDLQSPLFREMVSSAGLGSTLPRNMFQRPLREMTDTLENLSEPNSFWYEPNPALQKELLLEHSSKPANDDLLVVLC